MSAVLYGATNIRPVQRLHFSWTGWPTEGTSLPPLPDIKHLWKDDGLKLIAHDCDPTHVMLTFSSDAHVAPTTLAQRAKGRLQHAYRLQGTPVKFSGKISVRSLGENISDIVETYIRDQLDHVELVDPKYRTLLAECAHEDDSLDLSQPSTTNAGRYWYNLHLVFVTCGRYRVGRPDVVHGLRDRALEVGFPIKAIAVMPDHLHIAVRGAPDKSPAEIGALLQDATAKAAGCRLWQENFYVGTFSEYGLEVVRQRATLTSAPAGQARRGPF